MSDNGNTLTIDDLPEVLQPKDIQNFLGIGHVTVYDLIKSNQFYTVKIGRKFLIPKKSFQLWFEGLDSKDKVDNDTKTESRPKGNGGELNQPNYRLMAKAFKNLYLELERVAELNDKIERET